MTETTTGTGDGDPITDFGVGSLECGIGGHTGTEEGCGSGRVEIHRDGSDVMDVGDNIFGEGTVDGVTAELGALTVLQYHISIYRPKEVEGRGQLTHLVTLTTELAIETAIGQPLDTNPFSHFDR